MSGKMPKEIQCKDIPDQMFLDAVEVATKPDRTFANLMDVQHELTLSYLYQQMARGDPHIQFVLTLREEDLLHVHLVLAKARKLIRRGLLDGCACGCRGDFEVVPGNVLVPYSSPDGLIRYITYKKN